MKKSRLLVALLALGLLASCGEKEPASISSSSSSLTPSSVSSLTSESPSVSSESFELTTKNGNIEAKGNGHYSFCMAREEDRDDYFPPSGKIHFTVSGFALGHNEEFSTSSPTGLPVSALSASYPAGGPNSSSQIKEGDIVIDLTKVSLGDYFLTFSFSSENGGAKGKITLAVSIVEFGTVTYNTVNETVKADCSKLTAAQKENLYVQVMVSDLPYGCTLYDENGRDWTQKKVTDSTDSAVVFDLPILTDLTYSVTVFYRDEEGNPKGHLNWDNTDTITSGYSLNIEGKTTAFLTFKEANQTVTLKVKVA